MDFEESEFQRDYASRSIGDPETLRIELFELVMRL